MNSKIICNNYVFWPCAIGREEIDLRAVEQLVDPGQLKAIAKALVYLKEQYGNRQPTLFEILTKIEKDVAKLGLDLFTNSIQGDLAQFRLIELSAALNRLRNSRVN